MAQDYLVTPESLAAQWQALFHRATIAYAKPLLAPDDEAENLFQAAINEGPTDWPGYPLLFHGLAEIARRELRPPGETSGQRIPDTGDSSSPRELQIAEMAAAG